MNKKTALANYIAHKGKNLTEARYSLDVVEQKVLDLAISKVNPNSKELMNPYTITAKELAELSEIEDEVYVKRRILKAAKKLRETTILMHNKEEMVITGIGVISSFEYYYKNIKSDEGAVLKICFDEALKNELLYNAEAFQAKKLGGSFRLKGKWSYRIYDLLHQWKAAGRCSYKYQEFREIIGVPKEMYKEHRFLMLRVVNPAIKEINDVSDIYVEHDLLMKDGISSETMKKIKYPSLLEFKIKPSKPVSLDNTKRKKGRKPKLVEDNQSVLSDHMDAIYSADMQEKLTRLGVVHLNKLKEEGITEEIWNLTFAEEPSGEPRHLVTTARRIKDQRSIVLEQSKSDDLITKNKEFWEVHSGKYSGLMASTAYIQSNSGDIIKWNDDKFENKLSPFLKNEG